MVLAFALAAAMKIAVFDLEATGVDKDVARNMSEVLVTEIGDLKCCSVISRAEIVALLGFEKQKQMLNCGEESSCLAEIGGALGVDKLVVGSVGRIGETYLLNLRLLDVRSAGVDGRFTEKSGKVDALIDAVGVGVRRIFEGVLRPAAPPALSAAPSAPPPAPVAAPAPSSPAAPPPAGGPVWAWVAAAAGTAVLASGAYFGWRSESARSELLASPHSRGEIEARRPEIEDDATLANRLFVGGAVAGAAAGVFFVVGF